MASKLNDIIPLMEQTTKNLTTNPQNWTAFLRTAGNNYKYSFHDQVLIYAQRPNATACAPIDMWNKRFRRWINRGSKGIALIDDTKEKLCLRYVFDIADTFSHYGNEVRLWQMQQRFQEGVAETLTNSFGTVDGSDIPSILLSTAKNAADDHFTDYLENLMDVKERSFLDDLDGLSIQAAFRQMLESSIGYMLLTRCGYDASEYLNTEDFTQIFNFNTVETITVLGTASTDISEMVLREIESTVKGMIREEKRTGKKFAENEITIDNEGERAEEKNETERGVEDGHHLQTDGRLPAAGTDTDSRSAEHREIRTDAESVSQEPQESILLNADSERKTDGTSGGNRTDSPAADRRSDEADGPENRTDRGNESQGSDELGRNDEQYPSGGRRTDSERPDLQLTPSLNGGNEEKTLPPFLNEELLNELFCSEQHLKVKRSDVIQYFREHTDMDQRAEYMKGIYGDSYTELLVLDGQRVGYKKEDKGLLTWKGSYLSREEESFFSWGIVQEYVANLIERNLYFPAHPLPVLKPVVEQLSLFGVETEEQAKQIKEVPKPTFTLSQQVIDEVLTSGSNKRDTRLRICAWFQKNKGLERDAAFLREEFGNDGKGFIIGEERVTARYDFDGIHIARGSSVERSQVSLLLTWKQAATRIRELLTIGQFMPQEELDQVRDWELRDVAVNVNYLYREEFRNVPAPYKMIETQGMSFEQFVNETIEKLKDDDWVENLAENISEAGMLMQNYPPSFRIIHDPEDVHEKVLDLLYIPEPFKANEAFTFGGKRNFISDDEIDALLIRRGSGIENGKYRIYTYFSNPHTDKEKIDFLKNEYGTGGFGSDGDSEMHDSKGIEYSRGIIGRPYDKVKQSWTQVMHRIEKLIAENRYMSQSELDNYPEYEKRVLARRVTSFFDRVPEGTPKPFPKGTYWNDAMAELYTMQRYLQYGTLAQMELQHFDAWASTFGETTTAIELAPEGTGYRAKTRFSKFYNLPELMSMFKCVADIQTADMLNLPVPKANFHVEVIKPTEIQKEMVASLAERAEEIRGGNVDPTVDNMLKITNDGRKLALDQRLINPMLPDDENCKLSVCANNVFRIWDETKEQRATQLVFCDLSTPSSKGTIGMKENEDGSFEMDYSQFSNAYDDLKKKLLEKGVPEEEIAFIHEANTEAQKKEMFTKVRRGDIRILMGSTQKMGAGTNVQDHLIALHDLDCPWRPADLQQRQGRIVRQGNQNSEVDIFRYVTEGTFDSYLYQLVENKQKFIAQIMTSKAPVRAAEDVDETALSYAEIKALATGNPLIIEKSNLEMEVGKLNLLKGNHMSQQFDLEDKILKYYPQEIKKLRERVAGYEKDLATLQEHTPADKELFPPMEVLGITYTEKADAGKAIIGACHLIQNEGPKEIGFYRGFKIELFYSILASEFRIDLKGALSHGVALGSDIHGNITRIDNMLSSLENKCETVKQTLESTIQQRENAKAELGKPFAMEAELKEKNKRLAELNALLNLDEKDAVILEGEDFIEKEFTREKKELMALEYER